MFQKYNFVDNINGAPYEIFFQQKLCNVPDPPTSEEDATTHQINRESSPMNMNIHAYTAEA